MNRLFVTHSSGKYPIFIGDNYLSDKKYFCDWIEGTQIFIVTDEHVAPHYLVAVQNALCDYHCDTLILPSGEQHKTLASFEKIMDACIAQHHHRDTTLIALGGGVISDLTGFSAACLHRGVRWIAIPTTLLAQVDASIGGKTAVNHPMGKNMIGAFHAPSAVIIDITALHTLSEREFRAGIAEIIKIALIQDAEFFAWLEINMTLLLSRDKNTLMFAIHRSCELKRDIVTSDEKENHLRAHLNLGHTFGHAIEKQLGFGTWLHGEAVSYGIVVAATLSNQLQLLNDHDYQRIQAIMTQHHFLKNLPHDFSFHTLYNIMRDDKKVKSNCLRLILLSRIGQTIISNHITEDFIIRALKKTTWI